MPRQTLAPLSLEELRATLAPLSPETLDDSAYRALHTHYLELMKWNRAVPLIGPGTFRDALSRHYGESLAALPLASKCAGAAVDLGSGAGFPGFVLAAARPDLEMYLVEARGRKWSFLSSAARKAALPCRCLNVRVSAPLPAALPAKIDLVTVRALKLEPAILRDLGERLTPGGRILLWVGEKDPELPLELVPDASVPLGGSERRRILSLRHRADDGA
jgi:16S rRNA (guanine527-N7)-methyltransferase